MPICFYVWFVKRHYLFKYGLKGHPDINYRFKWGIGKLNVHVNDKLVGIIDTEKKSGNICVTKIYVIGNSFKYLGCCLLAICHEKSYHKSWFNRDAVFT